MPGRNFCRGGSGKIYHRLVAAAALLIGLTGGSAAVRAQSLLDLTPSDSWAVFKVKNLQDVSTKLGALAQQINIATMQPELADPLGAVLKQLHIIAGLNKSGDLGLAVLNAEDYSIKEPELMHEPALPLILVPVSDYQAFLGNFANVQTEGSISNFVPPDSPERLYATQWGNYAALSLAKEVLAKKPDGLKLTGVCGREMDSKDMCVYVNLGVLAPKATGALAAARKELADQIAKSEASGKLPAGVSKTQVAIAKVVIDRVFTGVNHILNESRGATYGVNFDKEGIATAMVYEFKPGSYSASIVAGMKAASQPRLIGLPDKPYLFYGASNSDSETLNKLVDDVINPALPQLQQAGVDTQSLEKLVADYKALDAATETEVLGMPEPTGALGKTALVQFVMIGTGDAKAAAEDQRKVIEDENTFLQLLGQGQELHLTQNATTIDGVSLDSVALKIPDNGTPQAHQMKKMMDTIYGPGGVNTEIGVVDDKHYVTIEGLDDTAISDVISAVKAQQAPLEKTDGFKLVSKHLSPTAAGVFYIDVGNILTTANDYSRQFGMALGLQVQPNLPPIGIAVSAEGDAVRVESFTPADLIQSMVSTALQAFMKMNGGGGAVGPGGL